MEKRNFNFRRWLLSEEEATGAMFRIATAGMMFAILTGVCQTWVLVVDWMRAEKLQIENARLKEWGNHYQQMWAEEIRFNDAIEKRFPNGFPPENEETPVECRFDECLDDG